MSETQKYWFAARTRDKQEFAICKSLSRLKSEEHLDVDYYLPTRIVVSQLKYRRKRSEVPVIRNLVFIRTTKQTACDLSNVYGVRLFYMKDLFTRSMLVVPDKQMSDFMFVMDLNPDGVSFDNVSLVVGDRVCRYPYQGHPDRKCQGSQILFEDNQVIIQTLFSRNNNIPSKSLSQ